MDQYEDFDDEFWWERRRRTRRLQLIAAVVLLALVALTVLSSTFNVINIPSTPPTTEPVYLALGDPVGACVAPVISEAGDPPASGAEGACGLSTQRIRVHV